MIGGVRDRTLEALGKYGDRARLVLSLALSIADSRRGKPGLGDFDYKSLVRSLESLGVEYNPSPLLRSLERDYGIVETTYHSSGRHWWRFIDAEAVREALRIYEHGGEAERSDEPGVKLIKAQVAALEPARLLGLLRELASKPRLTSMDKRLFRTLVFGDIELAYRILMKIEGEYPDILSSEAETLRQIIELGYRVASRLASRSSEGRAEETLLLAESLMHPEAPGNA